MLGRLAIPYHCLFVILGYTVSLLIHLSKMVLCFRVFLLSRLAVPTYCLNVILGYTIS